MKVLCAKWSIEDGKRSQLYLLGLPRPPGFDTCFVASTTSYWNSGYRCNGMWCHDCMGYFVIGLWWWMWWSCTMNARWVPSLSCKVTVATRYFTGQEIEWAKSDLISYVVHPMSYSMLNPWAVPWVVLISKKISEVEMNLHDFLSSTKKKNKQIFPHFFVGQSSWNWNHLGYSGVGSSEKQVNIGAHTRWAPISYKWGYNSQK